VRDVPGRVGARLLHLEGQVAREWAEPAPPEPAGRGLSRQAQLALLAALALPVAAALIAHGGFFPRGQTAFALAAAAAFAATIAVAGWHGAMLRSPAVLALAGLALLSALSAAWTVASPEDALRWAAVIAGFALIAMAAGAASARIGVLPVAALIAALAAIAGLIGLYGAGARVEPLAQRLGGQWSPGGPLEYSPALALMQVSALPVVWFAMCRRRVDRVAAVAAAAAAVAGSVVALAGSRVELAIAIAVVLGCVLGARVVALRARAVLAAAALAATAGGVADAIAGGYTQPYVTGGDAPRLVGLAAVVIGGAVLWAVQRRALDAADAGAPRARGVAMAAVAVPLAAALAAAALTPDSGPQAEPVSGFAHGRTELWRAAIDTAEERPVAGSGALSFGTASIRYQDPPPVAFAHNLPLESWAELGVAGAALAAVLYLGSGALVWSRRRLASAWLLGPAVLAFLVANLFDWPWHVPASGAVFAIALGALAATARDPGRVME
jgi:O-antigen ligase/polysaccharide polymerase Wzy-like membrane protein